MNKLAVFGNGINRKPKISFRFSVVALATFDYVLVFYGFFQKAKFRFADKWHFAFSV